MTQGGWYYWNAHSADDVLHTLCRSNSLNNSRKLAAIIIPVLEIRKAKLTDVKSHAQSHTISIRESVCRQICLTSMSAAGKATGKFMLAKKTFWEEEVKAETRRLPYLRQKRKSP